MALSRSANPAALASAYDRSPLFDNRDAIGLVGEEILLRSLG